MANLHRYNSHQLEWMQEVVDVVEYWVASPWHMHDEFVDLLDLLCSSCTENTDSQGTYRVLKQCTPWLLGTFVTDLLEPLIVYQAVAKCSPVDPEVLKNLVAILDSWETTEPWLNESRRLEDALRNLDHAISRLAVFAVVIAPLERKERERVPPRRSRDMQFLLWHQQGMKPAAIRDRWNKENPHDSIGTKERGRDLVKKAIDRIKNRSQG